MNYSPRLMTCLVLSSLALTAQAELINVTATVSGGDTYDSGSIMSGTGIGTYDTETSEVLLYMNSVSTHSSQPYFVNTESTVNFINDWGQFQMNSCVDSGAILNCGSVPLNTWLPMSNVSNTLDGSGNGSVSVVWGSYYTANYELSAVPVPAAAWLFGSALLTLAGLRRRSI